MAARKKTVDGGEVGKLFILRGPVSRLYGQGSLYVHADLRPVPRVPVTPRSPLLFQGRQGKGGSLAESTQLSPGVLLYSIGSRVCVPSTRIYLEECI